MSIYDLPDLRPFRTIQNRVRLQGGAVVTQNGRLESDDFETGVSGWRINGDGDVEFNDGVFRGAVDASALNLTISEADDGSIEFYNSALELVGRLSPTSWEIGDLDTPGLRATLDPVGGLRMRSASDALMALLDQQGISIRDETTGSVVAELLRTGFSLLDATDQTGITMSTSSVDSLAKPRYGGLTEAAPSSSNTFPTITPLTVNDLGLGHICAYKRGTAQSGTYTAPGSWTEVLDDDYGVASTLAMTLVSRATDPGTQGTATSSQTNWDSAVGTHLAIRGVVGGTTPTIRSTSTATQTETGTSVNVSMAKPTGTAAGDVLVAFIAMGNALGSVPTGWTTPEGWVFQGAQVVITGSGATLATLAVGCWVRLAGASEPATYDTDINFGTGTKTIHATMVAVQDGAVVGGGPSIVVNDENFIGPMQDYTPTYANVTIGNGTVTARYLLMGNLCFVRYLWVWGTTSSLTASVPTFGLPFTAINEGNQILSAYLLDSGTKEYPCIAKVTENTDQVKIYNHAGVTGNINDTVPYTFTTGDRIAFTGWYEIA